MDSERGAARRRGILAGVLLLLAGALGGIIVDRTLLAHRGPERSSLTVDEMVRHLELGAGDASRIRALFDTLHVEIVNAARQGPDSLHSAGRRVHQRLEDALPEDARPRFRAWIREHHSQMTHLIDHDARHQPAGAHSE